MSFNGAAFMDSLKRVFNPDEWMVRLLKLTVTKELSARPGVVIIQVDGLGHEEFLRAIHRHEMPNLARLVKKEGYSQRPHYCGLPSSTPSVQGSLFYGHKSCVPAFSFRDKKTGKIFNMFSPESAAEIEGRIKDSGAKLLSGGSAYGNIFTGGASEAHFCVSAIGWGTLLKAANPVAIIVFTLMHLHVILRASVLTAVELLLALLDSITGFIQGKDLLFELQYIPYRVIGCVIAREVTGTGVKIDIARGMPVIHANLAGYDEQAHHRGPKSGFAHWSLRGIDSVIGSIWRAAKRSTRRDYDVFIYSDHGQEETVSYREEHGRPIEAAVNEVLKAELDHGRLHTDFRPGGHYWRADLLRNKPVTRKHMPVEVENGPGPTAVITALGPLGHIYPPAKLKAAQKERIAKALVAYAWIPMVFITDGKHGAKVFTSEGQFSLPRDAARVFGSDHPFLREVTEDMTGLLRHVNAGQLIISGLRKHGRALTFYNERGSHAGPGPRETAGFIMTPPDMPLPGKNFLFTQDIRAAVFNALARGKSCRMTVPGRGNKKGPVKLKVMSYNIHACKGRDRKIRPERIARVIAMHNPDIIALQEVDINGDMHQAREIADMLCLNYHYHSSVLLKKGHHGNAILSRFNLRLVKTGSLPQLARTRMLEKRGAIWVEADVYGRKVQVINTHLSLFPPEGRLQAKHLTGKEWLGSPHCKGPVILCGDFNALVNSRVCKTFGRHLNSIHFHVPGRRHLKTFPSAFPFGLVDHIFLGGGLKAVRIETPRTHMEKTASDHLPLIAEVQL